MTMAGSKFDQSLSDTLTKEAYESIRDYLFKSTGIDLGANKMDFLNNRLIRLQQELQIPTIAELLAALARGDSSVQQAFVNSMTTNKTFFFRESSQIEQLKELCAAREKYSNLYIWSAACSTGQEPYSLAMGIHDICQERAHDYKILATDIDSNVLARSKKGIYGANEVEDLSPAQLKQFFLYNQERDLYKVKPEIQQQIKFRQANLSQDDLNFPIKFDYIFLRNVMIYFDQELQNRIISKMYDQLKPGGILFLGASEAIHNEIHRWESVGHSSYKKDEAA